MAIKQATKRAPKRVNSQKRVTKTGSKTAVPKRKKVFDVLYEDDKLLIINKPAGLMVHADGRTQEKTLADLILKEYPDMVGVGESIKLRKVNSPLGNANKENDTSDDEVVESIDRPGIVHRLDKDTTGVLVLCKTQNAFNEMKKLFKQHKVRKIYRAIVEGNIKEDTGIIDTPIARARSDFRKRTIVDLYSGDFRGQEREAITRYKVLERSSDKQHTYIECYPVTGRTHQIRVHLRGIRHPIIGDALYGSQSGQTKASRCMLHAYKIAFDFGGEKIEVEAPLPRDMIGVHDSLFKS